MSQPVHARQHADELIRSGELLVRTVEIRATQAAREFDGIGVPWDDVIEHWFGPETFDRGSVELATPTIVCWRHDEPIGLITAGADTDAGFEITGRLSDTEQGRDAATLLDDGVITRMSIGFTPVEYRVDEDDVLHWTRVIAREFSLVPFPAYDNAQITNIRQRPTKETTMPETTDQAPAVTREDVTALNAGLDELRREVATLNLGGRQTPPLDERSAGEVLRAIVAGDPDTIDAYQALQRDYTGGTTTDLGDTLKPGWVGDLTRIFDASSGVLADTFSTGTLPDSGMSIEYAELSTNTIDVDELAEGADMKLGKIVLTTKTAPVKTYAGGTQLTRQAIERATNVNILTRSLEALAIAAGARKKAVLRTAFNTLVTARTGVATNGGVVVLGATLAASTAGNWEDALIDAAIKYEALNLPLETLLVSASVFKKLRSLTVAGERVFQTWKDNASGELNLPGLTGQLAGLPVRLDSGQTGDSAVFANSRALRQYDSALVSLSDETIINLSKTFAVYRYGAVAAEIPAAVVPVKLAAS